jgi:hypothetical protein
VDVAERERYDAAATMAMASLATTARMPGTFLANSFV